MRQRPLGPALLWLVISVAGSTALATRADAIQAPGTPGRTGLLMGVIVETPGGPPVASAQVTLGGASAAVLNTKVLTDAEGRFVFMDLPPGTYSITASRPGYAEGALGRRRPGGAGQTLSLADAERIADLRIPLWKLGAITGRITDEAGEPMVDVPVRALARAVVAGKRKLAPGATVRTDDRGIYRLPSLVPGDYAIVVPSTQATAPDSVVAAFSQMRRSPRLDAPDVQAITRDMSFSGANDTLVLFERLGGARVGPLLSLPSVGTGRAAVAPAPGEAGRIFVYPTSYHPSVLTAAEAATISIGSGEERLGVDVQLTLVPATRVSGTVTGPDGPLTAMLSLAPATDDLSNDAALETATTLSDAAGRFTFLGVPAGQYQLRAYRVSVPPSGGSRGAAPPTGTTGTTGATRTTGTTGTAKPIIPPGLSGQTLWAMQTIVVGSADLNGLAVTLRAGFRVSGRAVFVDARTPLDPAVVRRMAAVFDPADARPLVTSTIGRGQFDDLAQLSTYQMPLGRYLLRIVNAPAGWTLHSATVNGRDISNVPLTLDRDITNLTIAFTDRPASVSGQVQTDAGTPDAGATVLVFPADPAAWTDYGEFPRRLRTVRADRDGRYSADPLPAGDYCIVAIGDDAPAHWQDPRTLQALARVATRFTLADREARTMSLRTVAVPR